MATINEATSQSGSSDKAAGLIAAIGLLSGEQTYKFELYKRVVLPLDGFIFWIKADELATYAGRAEIGALYNRNPFAQIAFAQMATSPTLTPKELERYTFSINGSLHLTQSVHQEPDATYVNQDISFTTKTQTINFDTIAPNEMYILSIPDGYPDKLPLKIAFGNQKNRYTLAGLWHYHGKVINSVVAGQVVDSANSINPDQIIVSNSLPYWLALSTASIPVYPSYLSPKNLIPPYVVADVQMTDPIQSWPLVDQYSSQGQLVSDTVEFTMYGLNNSAALDFQMAVLNGSEHGEYGIQNIPVPIDVKTIQTEFQVLAQKKTMRVQANYYQYRVREYARKLITNLRMTMFGGGGAGEASPIYIEYPPSVTPIPPDPSLEKAILEQTFVYNAEISNTIQFNAVAVDSLGNIYPSGAYTPDYPSGAYLAKASYPDAPIIWERSLGFGQNINCFYPRQVGCDNSNMIYTLGNISAGGGTANNYSRPMVQKWDSDGNLIFQKKLQYTGNWDGDFYQILTIPNSTDVYYVGKYATSQGQQLFIVKADSNQNVIWAKYYTTGNTEAGFDSTWTTCVALDSSGNICAVTQARYNDGARICGIYLIKISSDGNLLSTNQYVLPEEGVFDTQGTDAYTAIDENDNIYTVVNYFYAAEIDNNKYITYVVKINSSGEMVWQNKIHQNIENEFLYCSSITVDGSNNVSVCGSYGIQGNTFNGTGLFVKFSSDGQIVLSKDIYFSVPATSNPSTWLTSIATNQANEVIVSGNYGNNESIQTTAFVGVFSNTTPHFSITDSLGKTVSYQNSTVPIYLNVNDFTEITVIPEPLVNSKTCSFVNTSYAIAGYSGDRTIQVVPN